jgi:hypothetical protein
MELGLFVNMIVCVGPMFVACESRLMMLEGIQTVNDDDDDDRVIWEYLKGIVEEEL